MSHIPTPIAEFLAGKRVAVAGVSRSGQAPANAIFRKLKTHGYEVVPVNPRADEVEGVTCYHDLASIPGEIDGLMMAAHPDAGADLVRQAAARGIRRVWFHRSFGEGSVSDEAVEECKRHGITAIVGGCPMMYVEPDIVHRCMRAILAWRGGG